MSNKLFNFIENPKYQKLMEEICQEPFDLGLTSVEVVNNNKHDGVYMYFYNNIRVNLITNCNYHSINVQTIHDRKLISTETALALGLIYVVRLSDHTTTKLTFNKTVIVSNDLITTFNKTIIKH